MQKPTYLKSKLQFVIHLILIQTSLCINIAEIKFIFDVKARKKNIKCFIVHLGLFPPFYCVVCICINETSLGGNFPSQSHKGS